MVVMEVFQRVGIQGDSWHSTTLEDFLLSL